MDVAIVIAIFAIGSWWGAGFQRAWHAEGLTAQYYQNYFEPAVMMACGRGFGLSSPQTQVPGLSDFLQQRTDAFACANIPDGLRVDTAARHQAWYYLLLTVGTTWRIVGVSWSALAPLFGALFGSVLVLAFGLFRLGMGRLLAIVGTLALAVSSLHLTNLPHLRDYAKAPFVLALFLLMAWLVRGAPTRRRVLSLAAASGAVLGIGYGFRTDLLANIPPLLITLVAFLPGGLRRNLMLKAKASLLCLLVFAVVAWPVVRSVTQEGGCQWHVTLLGFSWYFDENLGIEPAAYDWGPYSDQYLHTTVGSFFAPRADAATGPGFCTPEYDRLTARYLGAILGGFPGDIATRAMASIAVITDLPTVVPGAPLPSFDGPFYEWRADVLASLAGYGPLLVVPLLAVIAAVELRLGLWAMFLLLWFGSLPMLQFHNRHYFHLEWIGWFEFGTLISLTGRGMVGVASRLWRRGKSLVLSQPPTQVHVAGTPALVIGRRLLVLALCSALLAAGVAVARRVQQSRVTALVGSMMEWTSERVVLTESTEGEALVLSPALSDSARARGKFWVEFLRIDIDPRACGAAGAVTVRYDPPQQDSTRVWKVDADQTSILTPVFQAFRDITMPLAARGCVRGVYRASNLKPFPVWLYVSVPADLQRLRAVQSYTGPERMHEARDFARFGVASPRLFARRVADLTINLVWPPWGRPVVFTRPPNRLVTRPEMRRVRARVDDAQIGYKSASAHAVDGHWEIRGQSEGPFAYLLGSTRQEVERGSRLLVTGTLEVGGLSIGMLKEGRWLDQTGVKRMGAFAVVIEPPADGPYDIIVANNEPDITKQTRATISSIAWIEPSSEAPRSRQP